MPMVETNQILKSRGGRVMSPAPKIDCTSNRRCHNTLKRLHTWLREEAIIESRKSGNEFGAALLSRIDPQRCTDSDIAMMNLVLFDE